jgi:hypothetical protein
MLLFSLSPFGFRPVAVPDPPVVLLLVVSHWRGAASSRPAVSGDSLSGYAVVSSGKRKCCRSTVLHAQGAKSHSSGLDSWRVLQCLQLFSKVEDQRWSWSMVLHARGANRAAGHFGKVVHLSTGTDLL